MAESFIKRTRHRIAEFISGTRALAPTAPTNHSISKIGGFAISLGSRSARWLREFFPNTAGQIGGDTGRAPEEMRRYARVLLPENAWAAKFGLLCLLSIIGKQIPPPTFRGVSAKTQERINEWFIERRGGAVAENGLNWTRTEKAMLITWLRDGDATGVWIPQNQMESRLRIFDGDDYYEAPGQQNFWRGITYDPITLRPTHYSFKERRMDDLTADRFMTYTYPASRVIHFYNSINSKRLRGMTPLAPAIVDIIQTEAIDRNSGASLNFLTKIPFIRTHTAKSNSLNFGAPVGTESFNGGAAMEATDETGRENLEKAGNSIQQFRRQFLDANIIIDEEPGKEWKVPKYDLPANYIRVLRQAKINDIATGLGISPILLMTDASNANYSAARFAIEQDQRYFETLHAQWCESIRAPIFRKLIASALLPGGIFYRLPEKEKRALKNPTWQPPRPRHIDPVKAITADKIAVEMGVVSLETVAQNHGYDLKEEIGKRANVEKMFADAGLSPPVAGNVNMNMTLPMGEDEKPNEENEEEDDG